MLKSIAKTITGAIVALVIIGSVCFFTGTLSSTGKIGNPFDAAKTTALNAAIDASGVKSKVNNTLQNNVSKISQATGIPADQVQAGISNLDVNNWTAVSSPQGATATGSYDVNANGTNATITTYSDPSYIGVKVYGQDVTFKVPASAQAYENYFGYLTNL